MNKNDNRSDCGPAFPACSEAYMNDTMGMSLRDYFAGQAMLGVVQLHMADRKGRSVGEISYLMADDMIKHRGL